MNANFLKNFFRTLCQQSSLYKTLYFSGVGDPRRGGSVAMVVL